MVVTDKEKLQKAMQAIKDNKKELALRLLTQVAESFSAKDVHDNAARIFEKAGLLARDLDMTDEALGLVEKATVERMRKASDVDHPEIVRLNRLAAEIALSAKDYGTAAEYCFRAVDFASDEEKDEITLKAVEALESLADKREEEGKLKDTIGLVKKVSRIYYSLGDEELGARVNDRALRTALRWAELAKEEGNYLEVGNALAEAAQILQSRDEFVEAARLMIDAGEQYESVHLYEKAGNIYDAAQEVFLLERLTSARNQAMFKAAEAYVKMDGKPEVVAPLMVKAGDMFSELKSEMKARWAYKKANELFEELAKSAAEMQDVESEKMYLRYQAMCLKKWGNEEEAEEIYNDVISYFLNEANSEEQNENKELEAASLEAASDTLVEAGRNDEAKVHRERAIELYVELADTNAASGTPDESSRFYSRAAESAGKLGDSKRKESFHWIASEKAEEAAKLYQDLDVQELATVWTRTAGLEALNVDQDEMRSKGTDLLEESAQGFKSAGEQEEAFEDLFTVYRTIFMFGKDDSRQRLDAVVKEMDDIAKHSKDEKLLATIGVIHAVQKDKYIAALLVLQENEEELLDRRDSLRAIIKKGSTEYGSH
jgi:tetratricopeptide (TPR) repeat protein